VFPLVLWPTPEKPGQGAAPLLPSGQKTLLNAFLLYRKSYRCELVPRWSIQSRTLVETEARRYVVRVLLRERHRHVNAVFTLGSGNCAESSFGT